MTYTKSSKRIEAERLLRKGVSVPEAARRSGLTAKRLYQLRSSLGIAVRPHSPRLHGTDVRRAKVADLLQAGVGGSEIARRLGISRQRVSHLRIDLRLPCEESAAVKAVRARRERLAALIASGVVSRNALTKALSVSAPTLYKDARLIGLREEIHGSRAHTPSPRRLAAERFLRDGLSTSETARRSGMSVVRIYQLRAMLGIAPLSRVSHDDHLPSSDGERHVAATS